MYLRKQTLEELNLNELATLADQELDSHVGELRLSNYHQWLLPQLVQHFSTWQILGDGRSTVVHNCRQLRERALWRLLRVTRSRLINQQTKYPEYGQLVPLLLLAHKRYHNRAYETWRDYPGLEWLVEPELYLAMTTPQPELNRLELQEIVAHGLTTLAGRPKPAQSTHRLTGVTSGHPLYGLPRLLVVQLCQIWLAHPSIRHSNMILDSGNWDRMPQPLVEWQPIPRKEIIEPTMTTPWALV